MQLLGQWISHGRMRNNKNVCYHACPSHVSRDYGPSLSTGIQLLNPGAEMLPVLVTNLLKNTKFVLARRSHRCAKFSTVLCPFQLRSHEIPTSHFLNICWTFLITTLSHWLTLKQIMNNAIEWAWHVFRRGFLYSGLAYRSYAATELLFAFATSVGACSGTLNLQERFTSKSRTYS